MGIITASRRSDCDIVIADTTISRRHAALNHLSVLTSLTDLGIHTRAYGNHRVVDQAELTDGEEIWIGKLCLVLDWVSPTRAPR